MKVHRGNVHSQKPRRLHRLRPSLLANRCHARKNHRLLLRVNPILVFAADQLSTSTVAHCKSIGSSQAARSRQQKPNLDFSPCRPVRFRDQFAPRINISYLESPWTIRYREIRTDDIIQAGARSRNRGYEQILPHAFCRLILLCRFNDFAERFAVKYNDYYPGKNCHQFFFLLLKHLSVILDSLVYIE